MSYGDPYGTRSRFRASAIFLDLPQSAPIQHLVKNGIWQIAADNGRLRGTFCCALLCVVVHFRDLRVTHQRNFQLLDETAFSFLDLNPSPDAMPLQPRRANSRIAGWAIGRIRRDPICTPQSQQDRRADKQTLKKRIPFSNSYQLPTVLDGIR